MLILNYAHPLTPEHCAQIEALTDQRIDEVRTIPAHLDVARPFADQATALADAAGLSPDQWQTQPLLVVLPSLNYAAAALLAELHGRMGYFPPVLRVRPIPDVVPPRFEVAEILDLQALRATARDRRLG
ncbi:MAG: CRISPR-associated protein Csx15 [Anaerolineae bacterium]